jgi:imidazolonepropionase-like amidohydrolase
MIALGVRRLRHAPLDTIRTATLNAADLLGVSDRGVIAPGKLADLIGCAVSGEDPSLRSG